MVDSRRLVTLALVAVILPAALAIPSPLLSRHARQISTTGDEDGTGQSGEEYYITGLTEADEESYSSGSGEDNDYQPDGADAADVFVESLPDGESDTFVEQRSFVGDVPYDETMVAVESDPNGGGTDPSGNPVVPWIPAASADTKAAGGVESITTTTMSAPKAVGKPQSH
ncbi:uncharacterized protein [Macrobrachium rosenbergii]|uniref:uncharacterized protein n=1 Tax=Macrobrachium rosenbergii TaxID=79674 RepID=UPI0034D54E61